MSRLLKLLPVKVLHITEPVNTLEIRYEDEFFLALEKPSGWHSAALKGSRGFSVAAYLIQQNPRAKYFGKSESDGGLINRLDLETSGLILAAKSKKAWEAFHKMFSEEKIDKYYLAFLEGKFSERVYLETFIGAAGRSSKIVKVFVRKPASKYRALLARSDFKPLEYFPERDATVSEIKIFTGRRHQIRAHAKFLKHPLAGDRLYGSKREGGFFLHAFKYKFIHPFTGRPIQNRIKTKAALKYCSGVFLFEHFFL